jgi:hypothetical protein
MKPTEGRELPDNRAALVEIVAAIDRVHARRRRALQLARRAEEELLDDDGRAELIGLAEELAAGEPALAGLARDVRPGRSHSPEITRDLLERLRAGDRLAGKKIHAVSAAYKGLRMSVKERLAGLGSGHRTRSRDNEPGLGRLEAVTRRAEAAVDRLERALAELRRLLPPQRPAGRPRSRVERDDAILALWNEDPSASWRSVAEGVAGSHPGTTADTVREVLRRARKRGEFVRGSNL